MYIFKCKSAIVVFVYRNYWRVVRRVKEKLKMAWRLCLVCPKKLMMLCTSVCWMVSNKHTKTQLAKSNPILLLTLFNLSFLFAHSQVLMRTLSLRVSWSCRSHSRFGIQRLWFVRAESDTSSFLRCLSSSARTSKTPTEEASTSTRASSW